jgi:murein tripeptide amidase MpaA
MSTPAIDGPGVSPGFSASGQFPGGSIEVVDDTNPVDVQLRLKNDPNGTWRGHYHFRITGAKGTPCKIRILEAANLSAEYLGISEANLRTTDGPWGNAGSRVSYDRKHWFLVRGRLVGSDYVIELTPERDICFIARWVPYSIDREYDFLSQIQRSSRVRAGSVGKSSKGAQLDYLVVGDNDDLTQKTKLNCWIVSRQHPSETMSGFFNEGLLKRLTDQYDPVVRQLLSKVNFHIIPNINPDGSGAGFTRVNGAGTDLNRSWEAPSAERSPEVHSVQRKMREVGVDFFMDCHGDEEFRYVILAGPLPEPHGSERHNRLFAELRKAWAAVSPDYDPSHPYIGGPPSDGYRRQAWYWVGEEFDCLSVILEQPFKDTTWVEDERHGWSDQRADRLGYSFITAFNQIVDQLHRSR